MLLIVGQASFFVNLILAFIIPTLSVRYNWERYLDNVKLDDMATSIVHSPDLLVRIYLETIQ